jgi:hypothetical protein
LLFVQNRFFIQMGLLQHLQVCGAVSYWSEYLN